MTVVCQNKKYLRVSPASQDCRCTIALADATDWQLPSPSAVRADRNPPIQSDGLVAGDGGLNLKLMLALAGWDCKPGVPCGLPLANSDQRTALACRH